MKKTNKAVVVKNPVKNKIAVKAGKVKNSIFEQAYLGFDPGSLGNQISQPTTVFANLRWWLVSNLRQFLSEAYVEIGLVQTIVDVPVDDAFRGGVIIKTQQLSEDQLKDLRAKQEREEDIVKVAQAMKWTRLYGGGGNIIISSQDPVTPLNMEALHNDPYFSIRALDMWELFFTLTSDSDYASQIDTGIDGPKTMPLQDSYSFDSATYFNYYGQNVHRSRVILDKGLEAPSWIRPRLRGWGLSVVEVLINAINPYLKQKALAFEVMDEFKIDVYRIKNLANMLLQPNGAGKLRERVGTTNRLKNYLNSIVMDSEDEYQQKQLSFSGLAEVIKEIRLDIASALRMPLTKIFGISAAGFNSGEDDIENYNAMIEGQIRDKAKRNVIRVTEMRCMQMFGMIPDDLEIEFKPLRILTSEQEENVKTQKFNRLVMALDKGMVSAQEFKEACNKDSLLPIQMDPEVDALVEDTSDDTGEQEDDTVTVGAAAKSKLAPKKTKEAKA